MDQRDRKADLPSGGRASGGGSIHVSFRSGSRAGGASARAAHAYITRTDEYDSPDRDEAIYTESDHMPSWAEDDPADYWDAADLYERANGRLYVSADFALPLGRHYGPAAAHMFGRGEEHERLAEATADGDDALTRSLDREIAMLEAQRDALLRRGIELDADPDRRDSPARGGDRSDDSGRGR